MTLQNSLNREWINSPLGSPEGLTLSRNSTNPNTQLNIAAGRAIVVNANGFRFIAINSATFIKQLTTTWVAGSGNGGRFSSAAVAANTTYHVFIIRNNSTAAIDFGFDTSVSAANCPSGWSARIIGSIMTDASSNIRDFQQFGNQFWWTTYISDFSTTNLTQTTTNLQALTVPNGVSNLFALGILQTIHTTTGGITVFAGAPSASPLQYAVTLMNAYTRNAFEFPVNTSGQIALYANNSNVNCVIYTHGFIHPRGAF